ncbi:MAG TPA: glutamate formimidoyltransferase [Candidatus Thermoplasmatota archaeon]|nr:glutamate formimidoyltransferase [Candidatus Thermoplasmatota archaeon]
MAKIVECVPNFSEGRNKETIEAIRTLITKHKAVTLLDFTPDVDHNRTDVTIVGAPEAVKAAALDIAMKCVELIDMNKHKGEHPRMGAIDVVPFIPVSEVSMEECVALANTFAKEFSEKTKVPCFLYEEAAKREDRRNLADVRRGEYEGIKEELGKNPDRVPDYGPNKAHPTAGATAVGARFFLIAFNVNLGTTDVEIAKTIAKGVRQSSGGYRYVKAMGFEIKERGIVQVSMNLTNYQKTPMFRVFETIKNEAHRYGVAVIGCEIVGLVPLEALIGVADYYLQLEKFSIDQVLEKRLMEPKM